MTFEGMMQLPDFDGGPADKLRDSVYKYAYDWEKIAGINIKDRDGWRVDDAPDWYTKITRQKFWELATPSTIEIVDFEKYDKFIGRNPSHPENALLEFAQWLIRMDDDDPESQGRIDRKTVTLNQIIDRARKAIL